jgi:hypothetical protein
LPCCPSAMICSDCFVICLNTAIGDGKVGLHSNSKKNICNRIFLFNCVVSSPHFCYIHVVVQIDKLCPNCVGDLPESLVSQHASDALLAKYRRFKFEKANPNSRVCSRCDNRQDASASKPSILCSSCGHTYCFTHGDAHPNKTCAQWARDNYASEKQSLKAISMNSKPCPDCKVPTQKSEGCNHMKCTQCHAEWCWICGREIEGGSSFPDHYKWWNVFGCSGQQFADPGSCGSLLRVRLRAVA